MAFRNFPKIRYREKKKKGRRPITTKPPRK